MNSAPGFSCCFKLVRIFLVSYWLRINHQDFFQVYAIRTQKSYGFHVLALSPWDGRLLLKRHFQTGELGDGVLMRSCLASLQPGTIVVLIPMVGCNARVLGMMGGCTDQEQPRHFAAERSIPIFNVICNQNQKVCVEDWITKTTMRFQTFWNSFNKADIVWVGGCGVRGAVMPGTASYMEEVGGFVKSGPISFFVQVQDTEKLDSLT